MTGAIGAASAGAARAQAWKDHDLVFATRLGGPIERTEDWRAWKALLRQAGV